MEEESKNVPDIIIDDLLLLEDELSLMEKFWDLREPRLSWKDSPCKYPFKIIKKIIRKIIKWIMSPYYSKQIEFNGAVVRAIGDIYRIQSKNNQYIERDILPITDKPRIIQIVSVLNFGDAVGNDVIAIKKALEKQGVVTEIYTTFIHNKLPVGTARNVRRLPELTANDIIIYHFASEDTLAEVVKKLPCKKILRYHNITPPQFFEKFDEVSRKNTERGLAQLIDLKNIVDYVVTVSEFNKRDLIKVGYQCPIVVVPIIIRFEDYSQNPSEKIIDKYSDKIKNIIFVGRIAPNKKIEDIITCYDYYYKNIDSKVRLILVGSYNVGDKYFEYLQAIIKKLSAKNIIFTGHIAFDEILGYYNVADVFLALSEHEGFCVPLVEAMYFNVPIVAYDSTAVADTLNGCGILLKNKDSKVVASAIKSAIINKKELATKESKRLKDFDNAIVEQQLMEAINNIACH